MLVLKAIWKERFDRLAQQVLAGIAEHLHRLSVQENDSTGIVDHDDGVGNAFQKAPKFRLDRSGFAQDLQVRDVFLADDDEFNAPLRVAHDPMRYIDIEEGAILALARQFINGGINCERLPE